MKYINQKKGFLLRDFVVVGIVFGLVISLYIIQVGSINDNYPNSNIVNPKFAEHYNKLQTNLDQLDIAGASVEGSSGLNLLGNFDIAFKSMFTVIVMVWDGIGLYKDMAINLTSDFTFLDSGVVTLVFTALIAMVFITLIFIWLSSVSRGKL